VSDSRRIELAFPGTLAGFEHAFGEVRRVLDAHDLTPGARYNVELAFEEIGANIVRYGSTPDRQVAVHVALELGDQAVVLTFEDDGIPFDPRDRTDPEPSKSLEDAAVGGLGLMLVRQAACTLDYCRTPDQHNRLIVSVAK
jgi:anti-sigma regulatory factor (Ser/Thr protein kinase)